jgi:hypothetical protein
MDARSLRELDHREGDGIEVSLLWQPADNSVYLAVTDHRRREQFTERVDPAAARDAFQHPYSYRSSTTGEKPASSAASARIDGSSRTVDDRITRRLRGGP